MSMPPKKKEKKNVINSISKSNTQGMPDKSISTLDAVIANLASHDDRTREKARHTLVAMGKDGVQSLIEPLKDKRYLMRWEAAKALGEIADSGAAPALVEALEDEAFDVRWLAAVALIRMNIRGLRPLFRALMERGDSTLLREGAHHVIHDLSKGELRKYLLPVLGALEDVEPSMEVPQVASQALEKLEKDLRI
jgi:HEAT repeat protein